MLSEEEIYKTKYMQIPITMLTDKNLTRLKEHCERSIKFDIGKRFREHEIVLELLVRYKQLETDKQKLIEILEKELNTDNVIIETTKIKKILYKDEIRHIKEQTVKVMNEYRKEILEIVKGEKE